MEHKNSFSLSGISIGETHLDRVQYHGLLVPVVVILQLFKKISKHILGGWSLFMSECMLTISRIFLVEDAERVY